MKFSVLVTFFCDGTGRDVTNGRTDIGTDRLFSENIILDSVKNDLPDNEILHLK